MAESAVLEYLTKQNRPFSVYDIQNGVTGTFGKAAVQTALDKLVQNSKVKEKVYGKQKVYHLMQDSGDNTAQTKENLMGMDRKINETTLELKEVQEQVRRNIAQFEKSKTKMTYPQILDKKIKLEEEINTVKTKINKFEGVELISSTKIKETEEKYDKYLNLYKKRKRMCMDMLNAILENYPKSKKHLFEDIGIETDEDVGFSIDKN